MSLLAFLFIAPTLPTHEWSFGSEAVNVATALEIRRTGHWLRPTLQSERRLNKPPLTAWLTAAAITDQTLRELSSPDPAERAQGRRRLAWQARWPSALLLCLSLIAIYELARALRDARFAILNALIAMSTLVFLRHSRWAQTDTQLAVWVTFTNAFLIRAFFKTRRWRDFLCAGVTLGAAFLAKGPIALIFTVFPTALVLLAERFPVAPLPPTPGLSIPPTTRIDPPDHETPAITARVLAASILALIVGASWFLYIGLTTPHAWATFFTEATRHGANQLQPDPLRNYLRGVPALLLPWTPFAAIGAILGIHSLIKRQTSAATIAVWLFFIPLLIMLPFKERKERYLAPLLGASALLAACGMETLFVARFRRALFPAAVTIACAALTYNFIDARETAKDDPSLMKPFADILWKTAPDARLSGYASTDPQSAYLLVPGAEMSIYLNRSVEWIRNPLNTSSDTNDIAIFVIGSAQPLLSDQWILLQDETRRHMRRTLYLRRRSVLSDR